MDLLTAAMHELGYGPDFDDLDPENRSCSYSTPSQMIREYPTP